MSKPAASYASCPLLVKAWRGVVVALTRAVVRDPDVALLEALADEDVSAVRTVRDATRQVLTELADGAVPSATATEMLHDASRRAAAHLALGVGR